MSAIEGAAQPVGTPGAQPERLARGVLSTFDIAASTLANIAPAMSFFFGFALIVQSSGIAAPLTIIAAAIAVGLLGNTVSQFSRVMPSTGSFVSFIGSTFGGFAGVLAAVVVGCGYILAASSVVAISGAWTSDILNHYFSINIPWQILTLIITGGVLVLNTTGAKPSTKVAGTAFLFELALLVGVSVILLVQHSAHISAAPFDPGNLHHGFSGLSLGFPLCVYLFIGWESSVALAEEAENPRHAVPRAVFASVALIALVYVFLSFATVVGAETFFGEISTLGTMLVLVAYLFTNLSLPFFMRKKHPDQFNPLTHLLLPLLGVFAVGYPLYELAKPGQPAPYNVYPWIALGVIVVGAVYGYYVYRKDPSISERVGSIIADH